MLFSDINPSNLDVMDISDDPYGNLSEKDRQFINATLDNIQMISAYYPLFLYGFGVPTNFLTIRILMSSTSLRRNFVSMFLIYLSFYNILNILIGLSQFWFYGMFGYEIGAFSPVFCRLYTSLTMICHMVVNWILASLSLCKLLYVVYPYRANIWCGKGVTHAVMMLILVGTACFHIIVTEGGKKVAMDESLVKTRREHYLHFTKARAAIQTCFFFYIPGGLILVVNFTIILLYIRTRRAVDGATRAVIRHLQIAYRFAVITLLCDIQIIVMEFPYAYFFTEGYAWRQQGHVEAARANLFYCVAAMMLYTNYSVNFIVYCFFGNYYRRELLKIFKPCLQKVVRSDTSWMNSSETMGSDITYDSAIHGTKTLRATASLKNLFHDYTDNRKISSRQSLVLQRHKSTESSAVDAHSEMVKFGTVPEEVVGFNEDTHEYTLHEQ